MPSKKFPLIFSLILRSPFYVSRIPSMYARILAALSSFIRSETCP